MANYSTIPHAAVDDSTPLAQDSKATPWRRLVASALVVSFVLGAIAAVAGAPFGVGNQFLTPLQYANLARLGHELAAEPLAQLVEARAVATRRKSSPAAALITRKRAEASECADCPLLSSRF